jgi:hypothetical protein
VLKSRQGVRYPMLEGLMVAHPQSLEPMPKDGKAIGEIFMRGNNVMKGYLKNPSASGEAFEGGWFHSGDLAVWHETATSTSRTARRTSSFPAARIFPPSRSRTCCTGIRRCWKWRWWRGPTRSGVKRRAPSSRSSPARNTPPRGNHRVLPQPAGAVQGAEDGGVRAAAQDFDRQDAKIHPARAGQGALTGGELSPGPLRARCLGYDLLPSGEEVFITLFIAPF